MKYPALVPERVCKTPIRVVLFEDDVDEDGNQTVLMDADLACNWQDSAKTILTGEQKYIRITGTAYFPGDICQEAASISGGYGVVFGERREIEDGRKARNPDGTVNYTEVRFR